MKMKIKFLSPAAAPATCLILGHLAHRAHRMPSGLALSGDINFTSTCTDPPGTPSPPQTPETEIGDGWGGGS